MHSLCVDLAMSTKDEKAIKLVHNAKPVTNGLKVCSLRTDYLLVFRGLQNVKRFADFGPMLLFVRKSKG